MNEYGHEWEDLREYLGDFTRSRTWNAKRRVRYWWKHRVLREPVPKIDLWAAQQEVMDAWLKTLYAQTPALAPFMQTLGQPRPKTFTWDTGDDLTRPENT